MSFASAEADARRGAPWKADFNRREGLRPTVGLRRPGRCLLRRRRPTPGAERPGRPISIGMKASGRRSACAPNEFGLQGPSADGRPAPTRKVPFASAEADAWRGAPWKADFNRHEGLRPAVGLRRMNSASRGLWPTVGLRRPGGCLLRRRRPTPGARAPWKADFNRHEGLRPAVGLRRPRRCLLRRRRPTPGARAPWKADFNRRESLRPTLGLRAE
jgi:hypothetical protein